MAIIRQIDQITAAIEDIRDMIDMAPDAPGDLPAYLAELLEARRNLRSHV